MISDFYLHNPAGSCQCAHEIARGIFLLKIVNTYHFDTQCASSMTTATILEDTTGFSISSRHLEPIMASGAQKSRLDEDKSSSPASSSFSTPPPDVMIAAFTPLRLKLSTWSTIRPLFTANMFLVTNFPYNSAGGRLPLFIILIIMTSHPDHSSSAQRGPTVQLPVIGVARYAGLLAQAFEACRPNTRSMDSLAFPTYTCDSVRSGHLGTILLSKNRETSEREDDLPWHQSPSRCAAIDHVVDETHFVATEEPHEQGSSAIKASPARLDAHAHYFGITWSNNVAASSIMAN